MKYFVVSDIHGHYDLLKKALNEAHFNQDKDTLIVAGDSFDRGTQSKEVLEYIMSCPNKILLMGNHDYYFWCALQSQSFLTADIQNGAVQTLSSFIGCKVGNIWAAFNKFIKDKENEDILRLYCDYYINLHFAIEFPNLIITHAWVPDGDWRHASTGQWYDAIEANSLKQYKRGKLPDKPLLIGHFHAWQFAEQYDRVKRLPCNTYFELKENDYIDCDIWQSADGKLTAIDGCSSWPWGGKVNVYVFESDAEFLLYSRPDEDF